MRIICFLWLLLLVTVCHTQDTPHAYIIFKETLSSQPKIEAGLMSIRGERLVKDDVYYDKDWLVTFITNTIKSQPKEKRKILFYIHGLWAENAAFAEPSGFTLQKEIFDKLEDYAMVVSIQWEGSPNYLTALDIVESAGALTSGFINQLMAICKTKEYHWEASFFIHSMGHRVLYAAIKNLPTTTPYRDILLCAGEITDTIFADPILSPLINCSRSITVWHHMGDKTLSMAKLMLSGNRLGIVGPDITTKPPLVAVIDVSNYDDFESIPGSISLHRYFYDSPAVRSQILKILNHP